MIRSLLVRHDRGGDLIGPVIQEGRPDRGMPVIRLPADQAAEYVDGGIEQQPAAQNGHSTWQCAICFYFAQHAQEWNLRIRPALRIQVASTRFRVPDVTVLDRAQPVEKVFARPPLAVFEVLSPEETIKRLKRKLGNYRAMGIPEI